MKEKQHKENSTCQGRQNRRHMYSDDSEGTCMSSDCSDSESIDYRRKEPHSHSQNKSKQKTRVIIISDDDRHKSSKLSSHASHRKPVKEHTDGYSIPSASYRQIDTIEGSHQYTVAGFTLSHSMGCGTRLVSNLFDVGGQLFRLEVYPSGYTADTSRYVSVFLTSPGHVAPRHVLYEIALLDQSGKDSHIISERTEHDNMGAVAGHVRGIVAAFPKFVRYDYLQQHGKRFLVNDMAVFRARVRVLRGWASFQPQPNVVVTPNMQMPTSYAESQGLGLSRLSQPTQPVPISSFPGFEMMVSNYNPAASYPVSYPAYPNGTVALPTSPPLSPACQQVAMHPAQPTYYMGQAPQPGMVPTLVPTQVSQQSLGVQSPNAGRPAGAASTTMLGVYSQAPVEQMMVAMQPMGQAGHMVLQGVPVCNFCINGQDAQGLQQQKLTERQNMQPTVFWLYSQQSTPPTLQ